MIIIQRQAQKFEVHNHYALCLNLQHIFTFHLSLTLPNLNSLNLELCKPKITLNGI